MTLPESPEGAEPRVIGDRLPEADAFRRLSLGPDGPEVGDARPRHLAGAFGPRDDESMSCRAAAQSPHVPRSGLVSVRHQLGEGREVRAQGWPLRGQDARGTYVSNGAAAARATMEAGYLRAHV